ncbi:MAG: DEAD/DEAH box helicase family protein [Candidatus Nealsonbacteria bacterium]|nr:DEAD/DEAH box helicase family protein [Candidatus Nealsonbacteria bacterium]
MKFKFAKNLEYQLEAIGAAVGVFDTGRNIARAEGFKLRGDFGAVIANELEVDEQRILRNVQNIQKLNKIEPVSNSLGSLDFSIEMETGTGKTYVYLRTILELNLKYGLKKFIILVPSVAIREGVLKTLEQTKSHFKELYNTGFGYFAYDSSKLSRVREFSNSLDLQIMIMTIQAFNSDGKVMRQTPDRFNGESPISLVAAVRPIVIMDEPQNMESELSRAAIADLNPICKLRYSATHKEIHNLLYRLTPVDAYKKGLVKKIQVFGVKNDDAGAFVFKVQLIEARRGQNPRAKVLLEVKNADGDYLKKEIWLKAGDDLARKTGNDKYAGFIVNDVDARYNRVVLSDDKYYSPEAVTENKEEIFRTQIKETIKAHFDKQSELGGQIKVLSLFFIDRVDNYVKEGSLIRTIFIEEFDQLKRNYPRFQNISADVVHKGYFASKRERGLTVFCDTRGDSKIDKDAYDLIMKDKERLLSFSEPVCFIFSHSALKEGWDNPNIFQICTLRDTNSLMKKRQEIGRGLRLPVDVNGDRVYDQNINILTVVANESYQEYVRNLQFEFKESGYTETPETQDARDQKISIKTTKNIDSVDFKALWEKINKRTKYNLELNTQGLIKEAVKKLNERDITNMAVTVDKVNVYFGDNGKIETIYGGQAVGARLKKEILIENLVERIAKETGAAKNTVYEILAQAENIDLLFENSEEYIRSAIVIIKNCLNDILINDGLRYIPTGEIWEIKLLFKEVEGLLSKSVKSDKSAYERVVFDSAGEKKFAESLENSPNIRVYAKLPRGFVVDTPLGGYTPDWAIVWKTDEGEKLYLVRETKFGYNDLLKELPLVERQKILCGKKHFSAIGFDNYEVAQKEDLSDLFEAR